MVLVACNSDSIETDTNLILTEVDTEGVDSSSLYAFFHGKYTVVFDDNPDDDSVEFKYNEYGLPYLASLYEKVDGSRGDFSNSVKYYYSVRDSTEQLNFINRYGGHVSTEKRRFNKDGTIRWLELTDMNRSSERTYFYYDTSGVLEREILIDGDFGDTLRINKY